MKFLTTSIVGGALLVISVGGLVYWQKGASDAYSTESLSDAPVGTTTSASSSVPTAVNPTGSHEVEDESGDDSNQNTPGGTTTVVPNTPASPPVTPPSSGIKSTEVSAHNSRSSCWSIINGSVYDLTSWIPNHPGGEEAILKICGKDGSAKFNGKHGGAVKQATILAGFKIGTVAQ